MVIPKVTGKSWQYPTALSSHVKVPLSPYMLSTKWLSTICIVRAYLLDKVLQKEWPLNYLQMCQMMDRVYHCSCSLCKVYFGSIPYLRSSQTIYLPLSIPSLLSSTTVTEELYYQFSFCWSTCSWIGQSKVGQIVSAIVSIYHTKTLVPAYCHQILYQMTI